MSPQNPFDDLVEPQTVQIQLISTWLKPFIVTGIITIFTLMLLPQLEQMDGELTLMSCASPILALMCVLIVDFMPLSHPKIHSVSKHTGLVFVFFVLYWHLWDKTQWHHFNGQFFIFCQSVGVITACGFIDKMYLRNKHGSKKMVRLGQIILTSIFLILPNTYNVNLEKSIWETILRIFLFTLTSWFQLFAAVVFEDEIDEFEFFNGFWWVLIVQRYMIPLVGFVWMSTVMKVSRHFSHHSSVTAPQISLPETKPLLDQVLEEEVVTEKGSPPSTRKPTKMFTPPTQAGEPRQRMLRRSWKSRGLQPKLTPAEQLAKLQALGSDVDAVV